MKNKKLCCRIFPVVLILVSVIVVLSARYFSEEVFQLNFLFNGDKFFDFLGGVLFTSFLPIALFYYLVEKEKYESKARQLALLGFIPAILVLMF
jgi:hypothetical protein